MAASLDDFELTETDDEYRISIHPSRRDRAKRVPGYRWDHANKQWVYPRTPEVRRALAEMFGATAKPVENPGAQAAELKALRAENLALRGELGAVKAAAGEHAAELLALQAGETARGRELEEARRKADSTGRRVQEAVSARDGLAAEAERLGRELASARSELAARRSPGAGGAEGLERLATEAAKEATGRDAKFCALVGQLRLDSSFPIEVFKELEHELRKAVTRAGLVPSPRGLFDQVRESELLTERGLELAHFIRKQRNARAHDKLDRRTYQAQALACLFAAALLWPEFSE
jgi:hypothetical protein